MKGGIADVKKWVKKVDDRDIVRIYRYNNIKSFKILNLKNTGLHWIYSRKLDFKLIRETQSTNQWHYDKTIGK